MLINWLDDTHGAVAASASLNLCMVKLDKRGFESPTQFYVVIPGHAEPELSCLVDKSDGKHTHLAFVIGVCLTNSAVMVCGW